MVEEEVVRTAVEVGWVEAVKEEEVRTAAEVGWVEAMAGWLAVELVVAAGLVEVG